MKKMMMFAVMMLISVSAAFAGNSDALKAILKSEDYVEANKLVQSTLDQLADNAEKASAYNKVVDLALAAFNDQAKLAAANKADEAKMYDALETAFTAADECYKYDQLPNAKGKVKERFGKVNAVRLSQLRPYLINAGGYYQGKDYPRAFKLLSSYININDNPMYADVKTDPAKDPNFKLAAYYAGYMALMAQDYPDAEKYAGMAVTDSVNGANALQIQLQAMKAQMKTAEDSVKFIDKCKALYEQYPDNQAIFANLVDAYNQANRSADAEKLVDSRLASKPNDFIALWVKGQLLEQQNKFEEAVDVLKKSLENTPDQPQTKLQLNASIGDCYLYHAQTRLEKIKGVLSKAAKDQFVPVYQNAINYYEAAKALDTDQTQKSKYAARLYNCYYFVYGENDPKTQEAKTYAGY